MDFACYREGGKWLQYFIYGNEPMKNQTEYVKHTFAPVYDSSSRFCCWGRCPPKLREEGFYYGHPRNRFWKVMGEVLGEETPGTIEEEKNAAGSQRLQCGMSTQAVRYAGRMTEY